MFPTEPFLCFVLRRRGANRSLPDLPASDAADFGRAQSAMLLWRTWRRRRSRRNADRRLARRRVAWAAAPFVLRPEAATHTFPEAHLPTRFTANRLFEIPAVGLQLGFFQALTWLGNGNQMRRRPSGRAARVSFRISLDSRSSSTRRASTIAPTIADQAAIAARRFSSAVSPSASALR